MKFTLSWLKKFLNTEATLNEITEALTDIGLEVEEVTDRSDELSSFTVAEILEANPHPNADKLRVCRVSTGEEELQIVCGAPNARAGIKVILAKVGVLIPNGQFQIKAAEIRGVKSNGMLCSETELLIGAGNDGIAELPLDAVVGMSFAKYYGLDDPMIEVSITPNRADCLGVYGIARDLAAKGIGELLSPSNSIQGPGESHKAIGSSPSETLFTTVEITNLTNHHSPDWLKLLLKNTGQTPISAVVDITNYICNTFSQPLHAYDKDKLKGSPEVTRAKNGEKFEALNGKEYELSEDDIVVRSGDSVECLAGIIGGASSACDMSTQNIVLEAAIFDPITVAKTGRRLHIDTDSRHRAERGLDIGFVTQGLQIAAQMIVEICGGKVGRVAIAGQNNPPIREIDFNIDFLKQRAGIALDAKKITEILQKLGFKVTHKSEKLLGLQIPSHRADISIKEDIVEEIIRIHGLDKLPLTPLPDRLLSRVLSTPQRRQRDSKRILASLGYDELVTWSFMNSKKAQDFTKINPALRLQNPISSELDYMRPSIIPNLLEVTAKNIARSIHDLAFFEVGPVFLEKERPYISGVRHGKIGDKSPHLRAREVDVFDIKTDLDLLLSELGLPLDRCRLSANAPSYFHPTRSSSISLGKVVIGYFGEIHPDILEEYGIKKRLVAFEVDLSTLPESKLKYGYKNGFSALDYQPLERDFAFVVEANQPAGDLLKAIEGVDKKLIKSVKLFDIYAGDKLELGKKSLAFSLVIQADDRTLTDEEIDSLSKAIIGMVESKFGGVLRSS